MISTMATDQELAIAALARAVRDETGGTGETVADACRIWYDATPEEVAALRRLGL